MSSQNSVAGFGSDLQSRVVSCFADVVYPGDDQITYDQSGRHLECADIADLFSGRSWTSLTPELLIREYGALHFFTLSAYLYYLPAYLRLLCSPDQDPDCVTTAVVSSLTDLFKKDKSLLTADQLAVLVEVMQHVRDVSPEENMFGEIDELLRLLRS